MKFIKIQDFTEHKIISLNRPDVKNAFHPGMIQEITETFQQLKGNTNLKAILLKGEGTAFCAGADLNWMKEMVEYNFEQNVLDAEKLFEMFEAIIQCEIPLIGVAHGSVFGGALGLIACCDYVYAEESTKFCFSEVKLGLAPAVISSFILRKIPDGFVRPLMLSGEIFTSEKMLNIGLAHNLFQGSFKLDSLNLILNNGLQAMRETKKMLNQLNFASWSEQKKITTKVISERRTSAEGQQLLKKYLNKV